MRAAVLICVLCLALTACVAGPGTPLPTTREETAVAIALQSGNTDAVSKARDQLLDKRPAWDAATKDAITKSEAVIGMNRFQVRAAWGGGELREQSNGTFFDILELDPRERWFYDRVPLVVVAYFEKDALIEVKGFDREGKTVALERGERGFVMPSRAVRASERGETPFCQQVRDVVPEWKRGG
jgi:hypothetical protein